MDSKEFMCKRCGSSFGMMHHLANHWKRKRVCEAILSDVNPSYLLVEYTNNMSSKTSSCVCGKVFSSKKTLRVHEESCKDMTRDAMAKRIRELEAALESKAVTITNNVVTNNQQVINFIINGDKINPFGEESFDHISEEKRVSCLKQLTEGIYKLCKEIYVTPSNQNVRFHKNNKKLVQVYNGEKWDVHDSRDIAGKIVAKTCQLGQITYLNEANGLQKWDEENADGGMYHVRHALTNCANPVKNEHHQFKRAVLAHLHNFTSPNALEATSD